MNTSSRRNTGLGGENDNDTEAPNASTEETRDDRFKTIIKQQLGSNGITLLVTQSFLFILALIMIVSIIIGLIGVSKNGQLRGGTGTVLEMPALVVQRK